MNKPKQCVLPLCYSRPSITSFTYNSEEFWVNKIDSLLNLADLTSVAISLTSILLYKYTDLKFQFFALENIQSDKRDIQSIQIECADDDNLVSLINKAKICLESSTSDGLNPNAHLLIIVGAFDKSKIKHKYLANNKFDVIICYEYINSKMKISIYYNDILYTKEYMYSVYLVICNTIKLINENKEIKITNIGFGVNNKESIEKARKFFLSENLIFIDKFEEIVESHKNAYAIFDKKHKITYQQLNTEANQLAHFLSDHSVAVRDVVGLHFERNYQLIVCILAVLKIGAAYVPLDPEYPVLRNSRIVDEAELKVIIYGTKIPNFTSEKITFFQYDSQLMADYSNRNFATVRSLDHLCYILFTSGSTGKPKGIKITNKNCSNLIQWSIKQFNNNELKYTLFSTSICFDLSIFEIFVPLATGNALVLVNNILALEALKLADIIKYVTLINTVPSGIKSLLKNKAIPNSVRVINLAGEVFDTGLAHDIFKSTHVDKLYNLYGPSECTTYATYKQFTRENIQKEITIGKAIDNTIINILDKNHNDVPIGVWGQIYISGFSVSSGYLNNPELTEEVFLKNPLVTKLPMYATGDIGYFNETGDIHFVGRSDDQVKLRGYRINLSEIEKVIRNNNNVADAVVMISPENSSELIAFYTMKAAYVNNKTIQAELKKFLPNFMIPTHFITLEKIPLTLNGKINRQQLAKLFFNNGIANDKTHKSTNDISEIIRRIWIKLLKNNEFSKDDNFFDVGGYSLLLNRLHTDIENTFNIKFSKIELMENPTISMQAIKVEKIIIKESSDSKPMVSQSKSCKDNNNDIAIVGMSCRFPGANTIENFWNNLCNGTENIESISDIKLIQEGINLQLVKNPSYVKKTAAIDQIEYFDYHFFKMSYREACVLDPQQRLLLESSWEALEDAGLIALENTVISVFSSVEASQYLSNNLSDELEKHGAAASFQIRIGNDKDFVASRIAYKLNLCGASLSVQTACSSSLVAIHLACESLKRRECDVAVVCAASLHIPQLQGYLYQEGMVTSKDGHCRAFDKDSTGTFFGNGVAAMVITTNSFAERNNNSIYALIKGSAINNDGSKKIGYTAPSLSGQYEVIRQAQLKSGVSLNELDYIESHGTGTQLGDEIEFKALKKCFLSNNRRYKKCALGAVKTNIGHLDSAAGLAGLIKTVLIVKKKIIPPSINFKEANPKLEMESSPFYIPNKLEVLDSGSSVSAGVSSFGIGGTNAHVVVQSHEKIGTNCDMIDKNAPYLFTLSAESLSSLKALCKRFINYLTKEPNVKLSDLCYTLQVGRYHHAMRIAIIAEDKQTLLDKLSSILSIILEKDSLDFIKQQDNYKHTNNEKLINIAHDYLDGKKVNWRELHSLDDSYKLLNLPTYPFARAYCWISKSITCNKLYGNKLNLPFSNETRYENKFSLNYPSYNHHHRLFGTIVVPGSSHLSMIISSIVDTYKIHSIYIEDIYFIKPFTLNDFDSRVVQTIIKDDDKNQTVMIISSMDTKVWSEHLKAKFSFKDHKDKILTFDINKTLERCTNNNYSGDYFYNNIWIPGLDTGSSFRWINHVWVGDKECIAKVSRPKDMVNLDEAISAGFIESSFQILNACWKYKSNDDEFIYVPYNIDKIYFSKIEKNAKKFFWSYAKIIKETDDGQNIIADVKLIGDEGLIICEIYGFKVRRLYKESLAKSNNIDNFIIKWDEYKLFEAEKEIKQISSSSIYIYSSSKSALIFLKKYSENIIDNQTKLYSDLLKSRCNIILDFTQPKNFYQGNIDSCMILQKLIKFANDKMCLENMKLIVITMNTQYHELTSGIDLSHVTVVAYLRSIKAELQKLNYLCIDLDETNEKNFNLVETLSNNDLVGECIIRQCKVFYPRILPQPLLETRKKRLFPSNSDKTYVITGGLGGIGVELVKLFGQNKFVNIVVLGRSDKSTVNKKFELFKKANANISYLSVDVSDYKALKTQLDKINEISPPIEGVFHCAGVNDDISIIRQEEINLTTTFAAKVQGTYNLHKLLSKYPIKHFVLFSSVVAICGYPGQSAYAAANSFLAGLAHYRQMNNLPVQVIHWGPWAQVGMFDKIQEAKLNIKQDFLPFSVEQALLSFQRIINSNLVENIHCRFNPKYLSQYGIRLKSHNSKKPAEKKFSFERTVLKNISDIEKVVIEVIKKVLGITADDIELKLGYAELGLDSLMAIEYREQLQMKFNIRLPATFAFDYPNIKSASEYLFSRLSESSKKASKLLKKKVSDEVEKLKSLLNE